MASLAPDRILIFVTAPPAPATPQSSRMSTWFAFESRADWWTSVGALALGLGTSAIFLVVA